MKKHPSQGRPDKAPLSGKKAPTPPKNQPAQPARRGFRNPQTTPEKVLDRAARQARVVEKYWRGKMTLREIAAAEGVSHETVRRDLENAAGETEAESKALAAFHRAMLFQEHRHVMDLMLPQIEKCDFGSDELGTGGSAQAGALWQTSAKEIARLTGAYLPEKITLDRTGPDPCAEIIPLAGQIVTRLGAMLAASARTRSA